jgi:hypothetical protein
MYPKEQNEINIKLLHGMMFFFVWDAVPYIAGEMGGMMHTVGNKMGVIY